MTAQLIDGIALSRQMRAEVAQRAAALSARGHPPGLAVILVGDDPASQVYVRNKVKACEECGVRSIFERYDASLPEAELLARIAALNADTGRARHPGAAAAATPHRPAEGHRRHRHAQGCRRLLAALGRQPDGRRTRPAPGHALRLHEAAAKHGRGCCAASTPWSSAAATPSASRWRCCCCRPTPPSPSATAPRPTWACTRARPTSWWPRSGGATR